MRTIQVNLYAFDELSDAVRQGVINRERERVAGARIEFDSDEYRGCLEKIEAALGIKVYDWSVDYGTYYFRWRMTDDRWYGLLGDAKYLIRWLNSVEWMVRKGKYYSTSMRKIDDKWHYQSRHSKVMFERCCSLTGCWTDDAVDKAFDNMWDAIRKGWTIEDFVENLLDNFFTQWKEDIEYAYEDETVEEDIMGNDFEFLENGKIWMN